MSKDMKEFLKYILQLCITMAATHIIFTQVVRPITVVGPSMTPTLISKEVGLTSVISLKFGELERFDIVVFTLDNSPDSLIKRVIGLPGETITYKDDCLYINGVYTEEEFLDHSFMDKEKALHYQNLFTNDFTMVVPEGCYLVLGDNRLSSQDSRSFGCIEKRQITGKGGIIVYPFSDFEFIIDK